jgi:3-keto-L-gulonate-6-phosphate decarboxylase
MKLQIAFDLVDLDKALSIASEVEQYADILEVGSLLIYKHGEMAIKRFKQAFPQKTLLADAKLVDRSKDSVTLFAQAGADWITVMAGAGRNVIHTACTVAHELGKKIMLDLLDASSLGQSALEAKSLGVDALLFHKPAEEDEQLLFTDRWEMVRGNTPLPIFVSAPVTRETIAEILSIGAAGIAISNAIVRADNPKQEAAYFASIMGRRS